MLSISGVMSFLLYSTNTEIRGISLDPSKKEEALAPISKISLAASVDFYASQSLYSSFLLLLVGGLLVGWLVEGQL